MNKEIIAELEHFVANLKKQRDMKVNDKWKKSFLAGKIEKELLDMDDEANTAVMERIIKGIPPPHKRKKDCRW